MKICKSKIAILTLVILALFLYGVSERTSITPMSIGIGSVVHAQTEKGRTASSHEVEAAAAQTDWKTHLRKELPAFGHRNWIVVADSAYPKQSARGIETVVTGANHLDVLKEVLAEVNQAPHVRPVIMLDEELDAVEESDAQGVEAYREKLTKLLDETQQSVHLHDEIIQQLDRDSKLFNVLLLKTNMTIPYTSVFIQLDCGYWNAEQEARLRKQDL